MSLISIEQITVKRRNRVIHSELSYTSSEKETLVKGSNGSGKTTLLATLSGLLPLYRGRISLNNRVVDCSELLKVAGFSSSFLQYPSESTCKELLRILKPRNSCKYLLEYIKPFSEQKMSQLSEGQKKLISIYLGIVKSSTLLLLDEPFNSLSEHSVEIVSNEISSYPGNVFLVDHTNAYLNKLSGHEYDVLDLD